MILTLPEWDVGGCKWGRHGNVLPSTFLSKVVPRYLENFRESGIKREFAKAVWNCFRTIGVDLRGILTTEEQRVFIKDTAAHRDEAKADAHDASKDWGFMETVLAVKLAESEVRGKLKEVQRLCEDKGEIIPKSAIEVIEISREAVEMKRDKAKSVDCNKHMVEEWEDVPPPERIACNNPEVA